MDFSASLKAAKAGLGELIICWLGQAGFYLKDENGTVFLIDPYFSNCGERIRGFKRLSAQLFVPGELMPDYYYISHTHFDHYDYDAIPSLAQETKCIFAGPGSCIDQLKKDGIPPERLRRLDAGMTDEFRGLKITSVKADHGTMAPDATGLLLEMGGHRLYFSGDSAYHPEWNEAIRQWAPDIACISINGKFGNMDAVEGARTALEIGVKTAIPCHFWTFAEHGGDPLAFAEYLKTNSTSCNPLLMRQGEFWIAASKDQEGMP